MKKRLHVIFALILLLGLNTVLVNGTTNEEYIRVGLRYGVSALTKYQLKSDSGFLLGSINDIDEFKETLPMPNQKEIVVSVENGRVQLKKSDGNLIISDIGENACLVAAGGEEAYISLDGRKYRGGIILKHQGQNKISVINILPLEKYLYGVVHREIGMRNPPEALKAQTITARTYATLNLNRHRDYDFDLCAGTHCQVYGGVNDEYESTVNAVDETKGVMIYRDGKPVDTYYYKNSGGHTQNSEDVWSASLPHLRGKPDPYCPEYPWHATVRFNTLRQMLKQGGLDPGNIHKIQITERNSAQAVHAMVVSGDLGDITLYKTKVRELLGASLIRSTQFTIGQEYVRPDGKPGKNSFTMLSNGGTLTSTGDKNIHVIGGGADIVENKIKNAWVDNGRKTQALSEFIEEATVGSFKDYPIVGGDSVTFYGLGYGHGVGMAQDGAIEMAKNGMSYMDILTFYYTDIEVY